MRVMLRSDKNPDVLISIDSTTSSWDPCTVAQLEQHIRVLNIAKEWLLSEQRIKDGESK